MRLEGRCSPVAVLPLVAGALVGACSSEAQTQANVAAAPASATQPSPAEIAQGLVRQRLGGDQPLTFADTQMFDSAGATIVCGRVVQGGQGAQRYIAIGAEDLFVEANMEPGHMDRAAQEFCRKQ